MQQTWSPPPNIVPYQQNAIFKSIFVKNEDTKEIVLHLRDVQNTTIDLFEHILKTKKGDYLHLSCDYSNNPKYVQDIVQTEVIQKENGINEQVFVVYVKPVVYFNPNTFSPSSSNSNYSPSSTSSSNYSSSSPAHSHANFSSSSSLTPTCSKSPYSSSEYYPPNNSSPNSSFQGGISSSGSGISGNVNNYGVDPPSLNFSLLGQTQLQLTSQQSYPQSYQISPYPQPYQQHLSSSSSQLQSFHPSYQSIQPQPSYHYIDPNNNLVAPPLSPSLQQYQQTPQPTLLLPLQSNPPQSIPHQLQPQFQPQPHSQPQLHFQQPINQSQGLLQPQYHQPISTPLSPRSPQMIPQQQQQQLHHQFPLHQQQILLQHQQQNQNQIQNQSQIAQSEPSRKHSFDANNTFSPLVNLAQGQPHLFSSSPSLQFHPHSQPDYHLVSSSSSPDYNLHPDHPLINNNINNNGDNKNKSITSPSIDNNHPSDNNNKQRKKQTNESTTLDNNITDNNTTNNTNPNNGNLQSSSHKSLSFIKSLSATDSIQTTLPSSTSSSGSVSGGGKERSYLTQPMQGEYEVIGSPLPLPSNFNIPSSPTATSPPSSSTPSISNPLSSPSSSSIILPIEDDEDNDNDNDGCNKEDELEEEGDDNDDDDDQDNEVDDDDVEESEDFDDNNDFDIDDNNDRNGNADEIKELEEMAKGIDLSTSQSSPSPRLHDRFRSYLEMKKQIERSNVQHRNVPSSRSRASKQRNINNINHHSDTLVDDTTTTTSWNSSRRGVKSRGRRGERKSGVVRRKDSEITEIRHPNRGSQRGRGNNRTLNKITSNRVREPTPISPQSPPHTHLSSNNPSISSSISTSSPFTPNPLSRSNSFLDDKIIKEDILLYYEHVDCNPLGNGAYGEVRKMKRKIDGKFFAVKLIHKYTKYLDNEIEFMDQCDHANIVKFFDIYFFNDRFSIVMELVEGMTLLKFITSIDYRYHEPTFKLIFKQILEAVNYLHVKNIIHRDLKCDNIMITSDHIVKILDFGVSKKDNEVTGENKHTVMGTTTYMAPEVGGRQAYDMTADIWSIGIIGYEMINQPISFHLHPIFMENAKNGIIEKFTTETSEEVRNIICDCLKYNPSTRLSARRLLTKYFK